MHSAFQPEILYRNYYIEVFNKRIILKWIVTNRAQDHRLYKDGLGHEPMTDYCEYGCQILGYIIGGKGVTSWATIRF